MNDTGNGKVILKRRHDSFAMDDDLKEDSSSMPSIMDDARIIHEDDTASIYLRGTIAGATSRDASEDPNFTEISDGYGPKGICPTNKELRAMQDASHQRYLVDPHYGGIIDAFTYFVIGKGFHVTPKDESDEVRDYVEEFKKVNHWNGRDRDIVEKALRSGECFVRFFSKDSEGRLAKIPVIRVLSYWEISKIIVDQNDRETVISYERPYRNENNELTYENIPAFEMIHVKIAPRDEIRARPPFARVAQACEWYGDWLFNRVVLNRLKSSFYLEEIVDGTPANVTTQDESTPDTIKTSGISGKKMKRMPKPGSKITHSKSVEFKWLSPEVKADDAKEDGRAIRLAIASGAQVPEFIFGDASNAAFASTLVSQNPFVRKIEWFQDFYQPYFEDIFRWVISFGIANKFVPAMSTETMMKEKAMDLTWWRRVPRMTLAHVNRLFEKKNIRNHRIGTILREDLDADGNLVVKKIVETSTDVDTQWPNLIAQDILKDSQAYTLQQAMGVVSKETLSQKLGYDYEEEKRKLIQESEEDIAGNKDPYGDERDDALVDHPDDTENSDKDTGNKEKE